jgi:hypothetical protein
MNKNHFMQKECGIYITHTLYIITGALVAEQDEKLREMTTTT